MLVRPARWAHRQGLGIRGAAHLKDELRSSSPMLPLCTWASRTPLECFPPGHLLFRDGGGRRWVHRAGSEFEEGDQPGRFNTVAVSMAQRRRGCVQWDFWRHPVAKDRARTCSSSSDGVRRPRRLRGPPCSTARERGEGEAWGTGGETISHNGSISTGTAANPTEAFSVLPVSMLRPVFGRPIIYTVRDAGTHMITGASSLTSD